MIAFFRGRLWLWELSAIAWLLLLPYILTAHGHLDWSGHALGRDFVNYWTAGHLVGEGRAVDAFTPNRFLAAEHRLFDPRLPFHFWSYPPPALLLVAPLALFPYVAGLIAWTLAGLALVAPALRAYLKTPDQWALALACPAAAIDVGLGQNGAITAALLIGGLTLWRSRPILAGALLGLLIFKPQIALLLPIAVIAERRWPTMLAAAASAGTVCLLSLLLFGPDAWRGFFGPTLQMQTTMLSQGLGPFQWMMPSPFMAGRLLGLSAGFAMLIQAPVSLWAGWLVWKGWCSAADLEAKAALLMTATFVASTQAFNYDLIPAACAALVLWRRDRTSVGQALALLVWGLPILMITLQAMDAIGARRYLMMKPVMIIAPLALAGAMWRLHRFCVQSSLSAEARASTAGERASNT
jgi:hypothetical protein